MKVQSNRINMASITKDLVSNKSFVDEIATATAESLRADGFAIDLTEEDFAPIMPKIEKVQDGLARLDKDTMALNDEVRASLKDMTQKVDGLSTEVENSIAPAIANALTKEALLTTLKSAVGRSVITGVKGGDTLPLPGLEPVAKEYCSSTKTSELIRRSIRSNRHMMVSGPAGSGKTYPLHQELNAVKRRHITVSCADGVSYGDLVVRQELRATAKGNETIWRLGVLPFAMENGVALILDEVDQLAPELLQVLNACLESRKLLIPATGDVITAHKDWIVGVTLNSLRDDTGVYSGFRVDERTCQRFMFIAADYLPVAEEINVVECATGITGKVITEVVGIMTALRVAHFQGRLRGAPSTRVAIRVVRLMHGLNDENISTDSGLTLAESLECAYLGGMPKSQITEAVVTLNSTPNFQTLAKQIAKNAGVQV